MNSENKKLKCPDQECISAYFDSELDPTSEEFSHIQNCPVCKKHLESYQLLSDALKKELLSPVPNNLTDRIISRIRICNKLDTASTRGQFHFFLKLAAAFLIVSAAVYMIIPKHSPKNSLDISLINQPKFVNKKTDPNTLTTMLLPSNTGKISPKGSIDLEYFFPVSTSPSSIVNFNNNPHIEKPARISSAIKQIWVVKNIKHGLKTMQQLSNNKSMKIIDNNMHGDLQVNMKMTKLQLVNFVRRCHKAGFKLLSSAQPQPEQNTFSGNKNDIVSYSAILTQP